ncbi:MAG TPA: response regulator transcription factor [Vicinamibacterales bacterium]
MRNRLTTAPGSGRDTDAPVVRTGSRVRSKPTAPVGRTLPRSIAPGDRSGSAIRLLLVDGHAVVRAGLRLLFESHAGLTIVGEAGTCAEAVEVAVRARPGIILLELDLGGECALAILPELLAACDGVRVLVLTGLRDADLHQRSLRAGAMGVLLKDSAADVVIKAIQRVHAGEAWIDRMTMGRVLADFSRPVGPGDGDAAKVSSLTDRERQVVALIGEGLKNRQIAERLFISETTVRHHLTAVFGKLEVSDRLELLIRAYRLGLAERPAPGR